MKQINTLSHSGTDSSKVSVFTNPNFSRNNKVQGYYTIIKQKVEAITSIRNILEYPESEGAKLVEYFKIQLQEIVLSFGYEFYDLIDEYEYIHKQISHIELEFDTIYDLWSNKYGIRGLLQRAGDIENNSIFQFIYKLNQGLIELEKKGEDFERQKELYYKDGVWKDSDFIMGYIPVPNKIESQGLTLQHLYQEDDFLKVRSQRNVLGIHRQSTIYTAIRLGQDNINDTIQHEHTHNIYEAFQNQSVYKFDHNPRYFFNDPDKYIRKFINSCQGEIIANYDGLLQGHMATELVAYEDNFDSLNHFIESFGKFHSRYEESKKSILYFENQVIAFYQILRDILTIANELSIESEIKSLMILYKPTQYHKIFKYLEYQYGKEKIDTIRKSKDKVRLAILKDEEEDTFEEDFKHAIEKALG